MFQPSQIYVRRFFCEVPARRRAGLVLDPVQAIANRWQAEHPECEADWADEATAVAAVDLVDAGRTNPFLHLSMHLMIEEQCAIDQPTGIRHAVHQLAGRLGGLHAPHHEVTECLGEMI